MDGRPRPGSTAAEPRFEPMHGRWTEMTRENKLALVVGFGLILLVGILISDHLSTAYSREPAELTRAVDPLNFDRPAPADLIAVRTAKPATGETRNVVPNLRIAASDHDEPTAGSSGDRAAPVGIEMGGPPPAVVGLDPATARALPYRMHTVSSGESLSAICSAEYGDPSLARELATYNGIDEPDHVEVGARIRLPKAGDLVRGRPAVAKPSTPAPVSPAAKQKTYTVRKGDVLTTIASRVLGTSKKFNLIFEANRDKLDDPDDIRPGMVLRIP